MKESTDKRWKRKNIPKRKHKQCTQKTEEKRNKYKEKYKTAVRFSFLSAINLIPIDSQSRVLIPIEKLCKENVEFEVNVSFNLRTNELGLLIMAKGDCDRNLANRLNELPQPLFFNVEFLTSPDFCCEKLQ
uniref:SpoVT-AbrB domain-containing protein n=1 Tax=Romanomermis culicivorax TaxID=13658 RepID=A0A915HYT8_ROMCU